MKEGDVFLALFINHFFHFYNKVILYSVKILIQEINKYK